jgi:NADH:ubiquinone oxidoreductase subunit E
MTVKLSEDKMYETLAQVISDYEANENNLIQILHMAQVIFGFIPMEVEKYISREMDIPYSRVSGVVSFYSFFSTQPKGEYMISVCLGTACYVRGGKKVLEKIKEMTGIDVGETSDDGLFSLQVMRCIGACGLAPAILINDKVYKQLNPTKVEKILNTYMKGDAVNVENN